MGVRPVHSTPPPNLLALCLPVPKWQEATAPHPNYATLDGTLRL